MVYNIVIGRDEADKKRFGEQGTIFLGKGYVKMGETTSLSNNILLDVLRSHIIMVSGKRGSGKSYSLSVIAEEMSRLPEGIKENLSVLIFDTMGIFWTMKFPNERQEKLLQSWSLRPEAINVNIYTPVGFFRQYQQEGIPTDYSFSIKPSELSASDWCNVFEIRLTDSLGILIERIIGKINEELINYSIEDIITYIKEDIKTNNEIKNAVENRFMAAKNWGLFSKQGTSIDEIIKPGETSIIDISCYTNVGENWSIKGLVISILCKKLLNERISARKLEEVQAIQAETKYFYEEKKKENPMIWIMIDEAHEFLPKEGSSSASDTLIQLLREGRQPGITLVLATQQPGEIHKDVLTQSDIVISHRLTSKLDVEALNSMMQSYLLADLQTYLNNLPKLRGSAIILDDNSERIYPMRVKPKLSWHGGEAPTAIKIKKRLELNL
ncbi:MAG: ATP-binding protein [Candidatus Woesearchaeota archaeon]